MTAATFLPRWTIITFFLLPICTFAILYRLRRCWREAFAVISLALLLALLIAFPFSWNSYISFSVGIPFAAHADASRRLDLYIDTSHGAIVLTLAEVWVPASVTTKNGGNAWSPIIRVDRGPNYGRYPDGGPGNGVLNKKFFSEMLGLQIYHHAETPRATSPTIVRDNSIVLPLWMVGLLLIVFPSLWTIGFLRKRDRARNGLCLACGYDLRSQNPGDKCPECGTPKPESSPNSKLSTTATETQEPARKTT